MHGFGFHPVIEDWFAGRFAAPTEPQRLAWPHIAAGEHTLISAPTGSGKTLTAFLAVIDRLFREAVEERLADGLRVVYISPLRALSNDMHRNLDTPLAEIYERAQALNVPAPRLRVGLRTGDTPASQRAALVRNPPHLFVTTPESLYLMLTSRRGRQALETCDTVIVDEIHALVRDKRGSHLALSLERLEALCGRRLQRIGISATQKPIDRMAEFLVGFGGVRARTGGRRSPAETRQRRLEFAISAGDPAGADSAEAGADAPAAATEGGGRRVDVGGQTCAIVDIGHSRKLDLAIETSRQTELGAVCTGEHWAELHQQLVDLIQSHRSTLVFVNTRRMAERITFALTQLLGEDHVSSHHGSLSAESRLLTEQRLKHGQIKAVVATSSLELGIDVGYIDLVVQLGSPQSIAAFLQRIGRSGHALGLTPKGRLFALTRDELLECMAVVRAVKSRTLDVVQIPEQPVDVLAQQIVAECAASEWNTDELFALCRAAWPYRELPRARFDETLRYLSEGLTPNAGRTRTFLHHDQVNRVVRGRKGAGLTAINNGGAIPEVDTYRVVVEPENTLVGSVDEEFAVESMAGDIFLLGNTSWRILGLRGNDLRVADAQGAPPTIPFWRGEGPGRTLELSEEVSRLREELQRRIAERGVEADADSEPAGEAPAPFQDIADWLAAETHCHPAAAAQVVNYVAAQHAAMGLVPTQQQVVFERFFDETGGMQLVVHAPFGSRINRAWGLAMRKRFCRSFDFELQATADDDGFILSLGPQHSFPIESLFSMLRSDNAEKLLEQSVLYIPMFRVRWRWNATRSLIVERQRNGQKVPPAIQRFRSEDALTAVFPKLTGCQEEHTGDHEIPDHPLARQTMHDCLYEAVDLAGLQAVLRRVEAGEITFLARDTREPSPFSYELLNANPYAFLDGGEVQERRARAVATRRTLNVEELRELGRLDPAAIEQVVIEAQPLIRSPDELHDLLYTRFAARIEPDWQPFALLLQQQNRAAPLTRPDGALVWVTAERWPAIRTLWPAASPDAPLEAPPGVPTDWIDVDVRVAMVRGFIESSGPLTAAEIADCLGISESQAFAALEAIEADGTVLRGRYRDRSPIDSAPEAQEFERADARSPDAADAPASLAPKDQQIEWCHRALLSRIHRLTIAGLRRDVQPVDVATYQRFLFRHQGVSPGTRRQGGNGLYEAISQLQGIDLPTICWERDILPLRIESYRRELLDELCLTGEVAWGRLHPPPRDPERGRPMASITRVAPVSLFLREDLPWLLETAGETRVEDLSSPAQEVCEQLASQGAMFAADILGRTRMLPTQLDDVLGELVARGFLTADGFTGLRNLVRESTTGDRSTAAPARISRLVRQRKQSSGVGRWSLWRGSAEAPKAPSQETIEHWAWQLLRRWGVVFRDLLQRESGAPRWFELVRVYRRLEARGEIRGGRFIKGVAGEQFATSEAVAALRRLRDDAARVELVVMSAADPLNLAGLITPGVRVPSQAGNRAAYVNGVLAADWQAGKITWHAGCTEELRLRIRERLLHHVEPKRRAETEERGAEETGAEAATGAGARSLQAAGAVGVDSDASQAATGADEAAGSRRLHVRTGSTRPAPPAGIPRPRF
ncbi:MAG: DEAD/DEAH box helicase [Planctomyces sp.]|nr:DEAD/DEAH box helicase [Planctomyces sp.]